MKNTKSNIFLALLLSLLTSLAGGIVFGLIYNLGYYIYFLAILEIILTCNVFFKFKKTNNIGIILLAIIWAVVWTFIFNFTSIIISEILAIANEFNINFSQSAAWFAELIQTEPEVQSYITTRILQIVGMIILGGVVYGISFLINYSRAKKLKNNLEHDQPNQNTNNNYVCNNNSKQPTQSQPINEENLKNTYLNIFEKCKKLYIVFTNDKNKETFKENLNKLEKIYITNLSTEEKNIIKSNLEKKISKENTSTSDKNVAKILLSIIK